MKILKMMGRPHRDLKFQMYSFQHKREHFLLLVLIFSHVFKLLPLKIISGPMVRLT